MFQHKAFLDIPLKIVFIKYEDASQYVYYKTIFISCYQKKIARQYGRTRKKKTSVPHLPLNGAY